LGHRETGKVYPVGDGVKPGEEDDGPGYEFVESDVFVKVDDAVERGATEEGDESATYGYMLVVVVVGRLRNRMRATSTWSVNAAARAMGYVMPNTARALDKLSCCYYELKVDCTFIE